jgi:hypothetical protein
MARRSVRLAKPKDQPQGQVFLDLDAAVITSKRQKAEKATLARKKRRLERVESTSSADTMIKDAMARADDLRDLQPALYRGSQLNAELSKDDPRSAMYVTSFTKTCSLANTIKASNETACGPLCFLFQLKFVALFSNTHLATNTCTYSQKITMRTPLLISLVQLVSVRTRLTDANQCLKCKRDDFIIVSSQSTSSLTTVPGRTSPVHMTRGLIRCSAKTNESLLRLRIVWRCSKPPAGRSTMRLDFFHMS